nr:retrovirus-related Pol polyprotein from transposon TNT 1-94 [Tanacetum cinerariifolium]
MGTVRFGNDHVAAILGFGDLQWGNILITRVYFVEGLGHNLFSVGQFCDSDSEVAFRRNACFVGNLEGVDLLNRTTNLYTINLYDMASASPICLMARASSTKSWLWHQRLDLTYAPSTITTQQPTEGELDLLFEAMYDDYIGGQPSTAQRSVSAAQAPQVRQTSTTSTSIADTAPTPTNSSSQATNFPNPSQDVDGLNTQQQHAQQQGDQAHL